MSPAPETREPDGWLSGALAAVEESLDEHDTTGALTMLRHIKRRLGAPASGEPSGAAFLRAALTQAAIWFSEYADIHAAKGPDHEHKRKRNQERADYCREALRRDAVSSGSGAEAVVREALKRIVDKAEYWLSSSREFMSASEVVEDLCDTARRALSPTAPGAPAEGAGA